MPFSCPAITADSHLSIAGHFQLALARDRAGLVEGNILQGVGGLRGQAQVCGDLEGTAAGKQVVQESAMFDELSWHF